MNELDKAYFELYKDYPEFNKNIELEGLKTDSGKNELNAYSNRTCETCIKFKLNIHDCCKAHPVTGEVTAEGYCPNLNTETGFCSVYKTTSYPNECNDFSCVHRVKE